MGARANLLEEPTARPLLASSVTEARPRLTMVRPRPEAPPTRPRRRVAGLGALAAPIRAPAATAPAASCTICCCAPPASRSGAAGDSLPHLRGGDLDDLAHQSADDALRRDPRQARRLPRRQPLHHLGLQVRAARGGGQAAAARLAGPRGADRVRALGRSRRWRRFAGPRRREPRDSGRDRRRDAGPSSRRTSARSWSRSRSTACRSTCSPSGWRPRAARSTRRSTTPGASCGRRSPSRGCGFDPEPDPTEVAR